MCDCRKETLKKLEDRKHFPGPWFRRETKDSPFKSHFISPLKLVPLPRERIAEVISGDKFREFYVNHLMFSEEKFYGHIADLVYLSKGDNKLLEGFLKVNRITIEPVSKYSFIKKIGQGGFGVVYLAKDKSTGQMVAIKRVYAALVNNTSFPYIVYDIEKETLLFVDSPHVIKLISAFQTLGAKHNGIWYVFEFASGGTLENIMYNNLSFGTNIITQRSEIFFGIFYLNDQSVEDRKEKNPYFLITIKYYASQLLAGVVHLHQQNIIHKDLKPENCLITWKGVLKITDLGLAAKYRWFYFTTRSEFLGMGPSPYPENENYLGGTVAYMEPEQRSLYLREPYLATPPVPPYLSFQNDYFSIAMIIFQMIFGFVYADPICYFHSRCYDLVNAHPMMFFYPREYLHHLRRTITDEERESFTAILLPEITKHVKSQENGLIPFVINGLQFRGQRWSEYCDRVKVGRFDINFFDYTLNLETIKRKVPFFGGVNFDILHIDSGFPLDHLLKNNSGIEFNKIPTDQVLDCPYAEELEPYAIPYFNLNVPKTNKIPWDKEIPEILKSDKNLIYNFTGSSPFDNDAMSENNQNVEFKTQQVCSETSGSNHLPSREFKGNMLKPNISFHDDICGVDKKPIVVSRTPL